MKQMSHPGKNMSNTKKNETGHMMGYFGNNKIKWGYDQMEK